MVASVDFQVVASGGSDQLALFRWVWRAKQLVFVQAGQHQVVVCLVDMVSAAAVAVLELQQLPALCHL